MNPARIRIHDIETMCLIGVPDAERASPQRILIDLEFDAPPARLDDIATTVDYAAVADIARATAEDRPKRLIETLAQEILQAVVDRFPVSDLIVRVRKLSVPATREVSAEVRQPKN
jgi:7,8-dihydroneopterin aldolase/epimerase/oxygenase